MASLQTYCRGLGELARLVSPSCTHGSARDSLNGLGRASMSSFSRSDLDDGVGKGGNQRSRSRFVLFGASLMLVACTPSLEAPAETGVCFRMETASGQSSFRVLARDVPNLESCAAQLEGMRMLEGRPVVGAYQGFFVFADPDQITASPTMNGQRIRVFEHEDRLKIQAGLRQLIEQREAETRAPSVGVSR